MATTPKRSEKGKKDWGDKNDGIISRRMNPIELKPTPEKVDLKTEIKEVPRLHVCGFDVQKIDDGFIGKYTHPEREEKNKKIPAKDEIRYYKDYAALLTRMVEDDVFSEINEGFDLKRDYKIIILAQQDPIAMSDEERRKQQLAAILDQGKPRFKVGEIHTKKEWDNEKIIYSAEKLKTINFPALLKTHGLTHEAGAAITGMKKGAFQQAIHAMNTRGYAYKSEGQRIAFTKLYKHFQKITDVRATTQGKLDRTLEKITAMRDQMRSRARLSAGLLVPAEQFNEWANELDALIESI